MKIFGKRKSKAADATDAPATPGGDVGTGTGGGEKRTKAKEEEEKESSEDENVPSYFASAQPLDGCAKKKKKQRNSDKSVPNGDDIQALLTMDPSTLNAKQRRLVRRHNEREGGGAVDAATAQLSIEQSKEKKDQANKAEDKDTIAKDQATKSEDSTDRDKDTSSAKDNTPKKNDEDEKKEESTSDDKDIPNNIKEILAKLEGLNSKERRKLLRQLKSSTGGTIDESVIKAAEEQAKKIAERNEKEAANAPPQPNNQERKRMAKEIKATSKDIEPTKPKKKRRKKGPPVDVSSLPPEERARREEQRRKQKEAAERREAGLVDPNRHPLNSERRRANRRKPSQNMLIAQAKKDKLAERGKFNAVGFQMRKQQLKG